MHWDNEKISIFLIWFECFWPDLCVELLRFKYIWLSSCCRISNIYESIVKDAVQSPWGTTRNGSFFEKFLSLLLSNKVCLTRVTYSYILMLLTNITCRYFFSNLILSQSNMDIWAQANFSFNSRAICEYKIF